MALIVPPQFKKKVLAVLEGNYNRKRSVLFPDLTGLYDAFMRDELN